MVTADLDNTGKAELIASFRTELEKHLAKEQDARRAAMLRDLLRRLDDFTQ